MKLKLNTLLITLTLMVGLTVWFGNKNHILPVNTGKNDKYKPVNPNIELSQVESCNEAKIEGWINLLKDGSTEAFDQLVRCKSKAVPALIQAVNSQDETIRIVSMAILGEIGADAKAAIPVLIEKLKDGSDEGKVAVNALKKIRPQEVVPALITALKDESSYVRSSAAEALGDIGPEAKEAVPVLISILKDKHEDRYVRSDAAEALEKIRPQEAVPVLMAILKDKSEESYMRSDAAEALEKIRPQEAVPVLMAILKDKNEEGYVRYHAAEALGNIGTQEAVPVLMAILKDKNEEGYVRSDAAEALEKIRPQEAVLFLIAILKDKNEYSGVRSSAAEALGNIGPEAKEAVPVLIAALKDEDSYVRSNAAEALGNIGPDAKQAIPQLILLLTENKDKCREEMEVYVEAVRKIAPDQITSIPKKLAVVLCRNLYFSQTRSLAYTIIKEKRANPPVMCKFPVIKNILYWKCPNSRTVNSSQSQPSNRQNEQNSPKK